MNIILLTLAAIAVFVGCIWAVGVALQGQQWDHEEVRRQEAEWEEMSEDRSPTEGGGPISFEITYIEDWKE